MTILKPGILFYLQCLIVLLVPGLAQAEQEPVALASTADDYALFEKAVGLSQQGNWPAAAETFREIAVRHPGWPEPRNNLAVALMNMGQLEQAEQALEDAVSSVPVFKTAHENRKRLYDYLAAISYGRAVGEAEKVKQPQLDMLLNIEKPVAVDVARKPVEAVAVIEKNQPDDSSKQIKQQLVAWSRAWASSDLDQYFASYSKQFKPDDSGKDYNQWRNIRRMRLQTSGQTQVELDKINIFLDSSKHRALAEFVQHYRSNNYQDRVLKQLLMVREDNHWLILSERVIQQLNGL